MGRVWIGPFSAIIFAVGPDFVRAVLTNAGMYRKEATELYIIPTFQVHRVTMATTLSLQQQNSEMHA